MLLNHELVHKPPKKLNMNFFCIQAKVLLSSTLARSTFRNFINYMVCYSNKKEGVEDQEVIKEETSWVSNYLHVFVICKLTYSQSNSGKA